MQSDLFQATIPPADAQTLLGQYDTPRWVAEAIVERCGLTSWTSGLLVEPTCGTGSFLHAIPPQIYAIGVEIDPARAAIAWKETGREIIVSDFRQASIPDQIDCMVGNPPFDSQFISGMLHKAYHHLKKDGFACLILPAYIFQTASTVLEYQQKWSIYQDFMPRNLFPGLKLPLVLARFVKDGRRCLGGFFLYQETADVARMNRDSQATLKHSKRSGSVWRQVVLDALAKLGGQARLDQLYQAIEPNRPTTNPWWKEQVRKVLQSGDVFFKEDGTWNLKPATV